MKDKLAELNGHKTKKGKVGKLLAKTGGLVVSAAMWAEEEGRRKREGMAAGRAPKGKTWVCPSDGKTEI